MATTGSKDCEAFEEENINKQAKDEALSSVSSNLDTGSDFVEEREWQKNDVTVCTDDEDLFIFDITDKSFQQESDVLNFVHVVLDNVYKSAQQFLYFDTILVDQKIQGDVMQLVRQKKELDIARIELMGEHDLDTMCVICAEKDKMSVLNMITNIIHNIRKHFENQKEIIPVDRNWQKVMKHFGYIQKLADKYPNVTITLDEKTKPAIILKGARDQIIAAADRLTELIGTALSEVEEDIFSPGCQFEIFTHPKMCDYIDSMVMELSIVWIPNHLTKKIHVFSKRLEKIMGIDKLIQGCVSERLYPLHKDQSVHSTGMYNSLEELKKKHLGKVVINPSPTGLIVTTADEIFQSVDAAVQEIINK
ncbi:hypothetical protein CHS0354_006400 [Potamilus streckersoni]|uniref:Uncharacterized protein n=1 Tax=Potamilus streckersoni TaxID=2493646 RepID=A0AAE0TA13_9BIVA|nr:hypothetical protein CHS0354_006400 [Potamilus streckersoni]